MRKYPTIIQGKLSYVLERGGAHICGEVNIPQEFAEEFIALVDRIERFSAERSM